MMPQSTITAAITKPHGPSNTNARLRILMTPKDARRHGLRAGRRYTITVPQVNGLSRAAVQLAPKDKRGSTLRWENRSKTRLLLDTTSPFPNTHTVASKRIDALTPASPGVLLLVDLAPLKPTTPQPATAPARSLDREVVTQKLKARLHDAMDGLRRDRTRAAIELKRTDDAIAKLQTMIDLADKLD